MDHCITKSNPKEKKIKIQIKSLTNKSEHIELKKHNQMK